jgi:hypothetical protein
MLIAVVTVSLMDQCVAPAGTLRGLDEAERTTLKKISAAMPEEKFIGFKPTPPQRNFGDQCARRRANVHQINARCEGPRLPTLKTKKAEILRCSRPPVDYGTADVAVDE